MKKYEKEKSLEKQTLKRNKQKEKREKQVEIISRNHKFCVIG